MKQPLEICYYDGENHRKINGSEVQNNGNSFILFTKSLKNTEKSKTIQGKLVWIRAKP